MNYYSHHIGDYTTDTAHLSLLEDGAYRRLMDRYYTTEAPLPADEASLFRVVRARAPEEQEAVRVVLAEFFVLTDAGWSHKRCDAEIEAFKAKSGKAAEAANKRWSKAGNAPAMQTTPAEALPMQCERIADAMPTNNQEPETNNQEPKKEPKPHVERRRPTPGEATPVLEVFEYWKRVMDHPRTVLDKAKIKAIKGRLAEGYSVADLCLAIDGCKYDPFSQGANDRQTVYDSISLICRDGPKVDHFIKIAERGPSAGRSTNAQQTIDNLQAYLEAHEN